jgi:hypothetical protein
MAQISLSDVRYIVKLPKQNTRVTFENYGSFAKYVEDLRTKQIKHELHIEYDESETVYKATLQDGRQVRG